jgi:hypothetical protein
VIDVETGKEKEAQIQFQGGMTSDQVSSARDHNRRMAVD